MKRFNCTHGQGVGPKTVTHSSAKNMDPEAISPELSQENQLKTIRNKSKFNKVNPKEKNNKLMKNYYRTRDRRYRRWSGQSSGNYNITEYKLITSNPNFNSIMRNRK